MPLLSAHNIKHAFGNVIILDGVSLAVEPGERVGIVGRNGEGKSTLLKILGGVMACDAGTVSLQRGSRAGYLHQDPVLDLDETLRGAAEGAFAELHRLHIELNGVFEEMASAQGAALDKLMRKQVELERAIEAAGGYAVDHQIDAVLHGLGFSDAQFSIKVAGLSGGQKGRLSLARLLLEKPDILLLDEPTNHLDIDGRLWLENFLKNEYRGAVLMISHDRYLLDNVVTRILEVEQGRLIDYPGNYEAFRELRAERRLAQYRAYENQQDKFRKEEAYIRRYKAGQRAKQARGRQTRLTREKEQSTLERPMEVATLKLDLPKAERTSDVVASVKALSKKYINEDNTEKVLFDDLTVSVGRGERWGVIGPNGAGKTTLVRCILGELQADAGIVRIGTNVKIGYYRQLHEHLKQDIPVWRYLQNVILKEVPGKQWSEQQARNLAGAFLFSGDDQERDLSTLSGGERSRAVLAGLLASAKNVLVLDEPTNHLDIQSSERLEEALAMPDEEAGEEGFEGTLILISHDRALIDATCDHLLVLDGQGGCEVFLGGYTDWHEKHEKQRRERGAAEAEERRRREEAEKRQRAAAESKKKAAPTGGGGASVNALAKLKIEQLEERITKIGTRIREIDELLADPDVWRDAAKGKKLGDERARLTADLEPLEFEWARRAEEA